MSKKQEKRQQDNVLDSDNMASQRIKILKDKCSYLYRTGQPFTLVKSGSTYELMSRLWNEKAWRQGFKMNELSFIQAVKNYVNKEEIALKFIDIDYQAKPIDYIRVNKHKSGDVVTDLVYIDINSAYWETARILSVIDEKLYLRGLEVDKTVRLAALGSLARQKHVWEFNGKRFIKKEPEGLPTDNIWFAICRRVSDVMVRISKKLGNNFVFYWVDGIYVKDDGKSVSYVIEEFIKEGYTSKFCKIPYVKFNDMGFTVQGMVNSDVKEFSWDVSGKGKASQPITKYIEDKKLLALANEIMYRGSKKEPKKGKK